MRRPTNRRTEFGGFTFVEAMIVLAILFIVGSFVLRAVFHDELTSWEDGFWTSLGLEPTAMKMGSASVFLFGLFVLAFWRGWKKK
jgi:hypothetical protein